MKSTSKTLGFMELSDLALKQETAAKEGRKALLEENHEEFCKKYVQVLKALGECTGRDIDESDTENDEHIPNEIPAAVSGGKEIEDWDSLKSDLIKRLESFESKSVEECIDKARGQSLFGKPVEVTLAGVAEKASNFDFDGAIAELNEIGGKA